MSEYDLTTSDGIKAWLQTLPEDEWRGAVIVLFSRTAMSLLPDAIRPLPKTERGRKTWRSVIMPWQRSLLVLQCAHFNESFDTRTSASTALSQVVATSLASGVLVPKRGRLFVELIRTALFVASQKSHHVVQWTDVYVTIRECFEVLGSSSALVDEMSWVEQVGLDQAVRAPLQPRAVKAETDQRWDSLRASFDADKVDWSFWAYW